MDTKRQKLLRFLIEKLGCAAKEIHAGQSFPFGELKLGRQQAMTLFFIAEHQDGVAAKELARLLRVTPGAVTQFVDILVAKRLVKRTGDAQDHRSYKISLTPPAAQQFNRFKKNYFKTVSLAFADFSTVELEKFIALVGKIKGADNRSKKGNL
jgi:DNA-binding MarR family transcriptional regulator